MLRDWLKLILKNSQNKNRFFVRTELKEVIQGYILNFVYNNNTYKRLIFTGGTCLRKIYGLPRLSEDLDFNYLGKLSITNFSKKLKDYFAKDLQYKEVEAKIAGHGRTVFLKFPKVLAEIGVANNLSESQMLFVRCDFASETGRDFGTSINAISTNDFSFFALSYDLPTLFANKMIAFLERGFFKGGKQEIAFKGRDLFDISWFLSESVRTGFSLQPRWSRIFREIGSTDKKEIVEAMVHKVERIKKQDLVVDLYPFIESAATIENFGENFRQIVIEKLTLMADRSI